MIDRQGAGKLRARVPLVEGCDPAVRRAYSSRRVGAIPHTRPGPSPSMTRRRSHLREALTPPAGQSHLRSRVEILTLLAWKSRELKIAFIFMRRFRHAFCVSSMNRLGNVSSRPTTKTTQQPINYEKHKTQKFTDSGSIRYRLFLARRWRRSSGRRSEL